MKKYKSEITLFVATLLMFMGIIINGCEKTKHDPCDDTVKPEKAITLKVIGHVLNLNDEAVSNELLKIEVYKTPCGAESKGFFNFEGETNQNGIFMSSIIGYNLRNEDDEVYAGVVAPELENFFERNFVNQYYEYNDFWSGSMKEIHLYIYSQDQ